MRPISLARSLTALMLAALLPPIFDTADARVGAGQSAAITGTVRSNQDGPLEGVIVIAKRKDDSVLTAVSTDAAGRFAFPRDHIGAGLYAITIRATGFEWPGSDDEHRVSVGARAAASLRITLAPVKDQSRLASQLTSLEWLISFPGADAQKDVITHNVVNCGFCHSLERIARSNHTAEEFRSVIARMSTYEPDHSGIDRIQIAAPLPPVDGLHWWGRDAKAMADYLATVNLSGGKATWSYPLKTLPRPRGKATQAIVTVFPIPRPQSVIHDLDVDSKGAVWYGNSGWDYLGRFEPDTGRFSEWAAPNHLPAAAAGLDRIQGVQDIQVDPDDHVWAAVGGTKIAMFAPERTEWRAFDVPVVWLNPFRAPIHQGQRAIWVTGVTPSTDKLWHEAAFRLDFDSGKLGNGIQLYDGRPAPDDPGHANPFHYCYMMDQDKDGNFLCTDPAGSALVRADAASGQVKLIPTVTPNAYPRRGYRDQQNRFWFGEFYADKIGVIDLNTDVVKEFDTAQKYLSPYYARPDNHGKIWVSSTGSDRLLRLDPQTGEILQYLMPVAYDARKVVVDLRAKVTTVWLPNKNAAQLIRIEVPD